MQHGLAGVRRNRGVARNAVKIPHPHLSGWDYLAVAVFVLFISALGKLAFGAVTVDAVVTIPQYNLNSTTATWSHTVAGSDNFLAVYLTARTLGASNFSVSINGTVAARAIDSDSANGACAEIWYLNNPAAGVYTVLIRSNAIVARGRAASISYNGVNTAAATVFTGGATATSGNPTVTVTTTAGDFVVDVATLRVSGATLAVGPGQTERFNIGYTGAPTSQFGTGAGSDEVATGASTTMSWTAAGGDDWALSTMGLKPLPTTPTRFMAPNTMRFW